jgi:hypothetical protein
MILLLIRLYRILAEYFLNDQNTYPKLGAAPVNAIFVPAASNSSIVQAAGRLMDG